MYPTTILGMALLAFSGVLIRIHLRTWRAAAAGDLSQRDREFAWRQFRRRMQSSAMIGIAAVTIIAAPYVTSAASPLVSLFYLIGLFVLVLWVVLLAMVDVIATHRHYVMLQRGELNQIASKNAEARRQQQDRQGQDDETTT
jgi:hypothetical protein